MGKIIVINQLTLDGVMQGPGRPDEDARDGFEYVASSNPATKLNWLNSTSLAI